uniref:Uncharacterized protein LOC101492680 n=1 Tax=Cicer arietinum TaxID=3827 RepID=A0A1S2XAH2_CICAR|nr:uncharacterized protein LOC101492680 [Cicer arietinum]XP_004486289.1 uncharacterized protein LOC101493016 [Cicer arietinum]
MANLKCILTTLFFVFLMTISHTSSSSSHSSNNNNQEIQSQSPSSTIPSTISNYHQVFYLKNTDSTPMFLRKQERVKNRRMNRNKNMKQRKQRKQRKKMVKNMMQSSRPFSVMLPKGFVPPSGSSPCHNNQPNSVSFHCHLTNTEP